MTSPNTPYTSHQGYIVGKCVILDVCFFFFSSRSTAVPLPCTIAFGARTSLETAAIARQTAILGSGCIYPANAVSVPLSLFLSLPAQTHTQLTGFC